MEAQESCDKAVDLQNYT